MNRGPGLGIVKAGELDNSEVTAKSPGFQRPAAEWRAREHLYDRLSHCEWALEFLWDDIVDTDIPLWRINDRLGWILREHADVCHQLWPASSRSAVEQ